MLSQRNRPQRGAFTLVEVLVVIAILVILMSLTLVILSRVWRKIDISATTVEISKLQEGLERFKSAFGRYPPSRIVLCETAGQWQGLLASGDAKQRRLAEESLEFLQAAFPGIELTNPAVSHDWSGRRQHPIVNNNFTGLIDAAGGVQGPYLLEGQEAIVYWLGGMRYDNNPGVPFNPANAATKDFRTPATGWSSNKQRPCAPPSTAGGEKRLGPFYEMDEGRVLYSCFNPSVNGLPVWNAAQSGGRFPVFMDRFGMPYAYFRAVGGGAMNSYRFLGAVAMPPGGGTDAYLFDCQQLMSQSGSPNWVPYWVNCSPPQAANVVIPPANTQTTFHKAERFQIISAGPDKLYGTGGRLDPKNPEQYLTNPADFDNVTNVTEGQIKP